MNMTSPEGQQPKPAEAGLDGAFDALKAFEQQYKPAEPQEPEVVITDPAKAAPETPENQQAPSSEPTPEDGADNTGFNGDEDAENGLPPSDDGEQPTPSSEAKKHTAETENEATVLGRYARAYDAWAKDKENDRPYVDLKDVPASERKNLRPKDVENLPEEAFLTAPRSFVKSLPKETREAWRDKANALKASLIEMTPADIHRLAKDDADFLRLLTSRHTRFMSDETREAIAEEGRRFFTESPIKIAQRKLGRMAVSLHPEVAKRRIQAIEAGNEEAKSRAEAQAKIDTEEAIKEAKNYTITSDDVYEADSPLIGKTDQEILNLADDEKAYSKLSGDDYHDLLRLSREARSRLGLVDRGNDGFVFGFGYEEKQPSLSARVAAGLGGLAAKVSLKRDQSGTKAKSEDGTPQPLSEEEQRILDATKTPEANTEQKSFQERARERGRKILDSLNTENAKAAGSKIAELSGKAKGRVDKAILDTIVAIPGVSKKLESKFFEVDMATGERKPTREGKVYVGIAGAVGSIAVALGVYNLLSDNSDIAQQANEVAASTSAQPTGTSSAAQPAVETTTATAAPTTTTEAVPTTTSAPSSSSSAAEATTSSARTTSSQAPTTTSTSQPTPTTTGNPAPGTVERPEGTPGRANIPDGHEAGIDNTASATPEPELKTNYTEKATTLQPDSNVWDSSEQYWIDGGFDGSEADLEKLTDALKDWRLEQMGLSEADAFNMQPGLKMPMPNPAELQQLIDEAFKLKS